MLNLFFRPFFCEASVLNVRQGSGWTPHSIGHASQPCEPDVARRCSNRTSLTYGQTPGEFSARRPKRWKRPTWGAPPGAPSRLVVLDEVWSGARDGRPSRNAPCRGRRTRTNAARKNFIKQRSHRAFSPVSPDRHPTGPGHAILLTSFRHCVRIGGSQLEASPRGQSGRVRCRHRPRGILYFSWLFFPSYFR